MLSTAIGLADASGDAVSVILGDMSLAYDLNALLLLTRAKAPLHVWCINNRGGGIFEAPIQNSDLCDPYFVMPQPCLLHAAKMVDLPYVSLESIETPWFCPNSSCLIECRVSFDQTQAVDASI